MPENNRDKTGKFLKGSSGNPQGKPLGTKNKFTTLKKAFLDAFERTGEVDGLVEWVKKSPKNRGQFYQMLARMLPTKVKDEDEEKQTLNVIISDEYRPKVEK